MSCVRVKNATGDTCIFRACGYETCPAHGLSREAGFIHPQGIKTGLVHYANSTCQFGAVCGQVSYCSDLHRTHRLAELARLRVNVSLYSYCSLPSTTLPSLVSFESPTLRIITVRPYPDSLSFS